MGSQAVAAVPTPGNDTVTASPTGTLDVLGNDTDPDGDALTVVTTSQPARGSVTCSPLGACLYSTQDRVQGSDTFTYTVRDPQGEQATATVNVTIAATTVNNAVVARDDDVATAVGKPITIRVLDNDTAAGRVIGSHTAPKHGDAT